jgi:hypothetical protein
VAHRVAAANADCGNAGVVTRDDHPFPFGSSIRFTCSPTCGQFFRNRTMRCPLGFDLDLLYCPLMQTTNEDLGRHLRIGPFQLFIHESGLDRSLPDHITDPIPRYHISNDLWRTFTIEGVAKTIAALSKHDVASLRTCHCRTDHRKARCRSQALVFVCSLGITPTLDVVL